MRRDRSGRTSAVALATALLLAALLLAACGSSSSSTTKASTAAASGATGSSGKRGARFTELRACLQKQGITLPQPKQAPANPGSGSPPGGGLPFGGGNGAPRFQLPKGVTQAQLRAALKKCAGQGFRGFGGTGRVRSPAFTKALAGFAQCMRKNGIAVPKPNTSGKGPIFSTKGLDTTSAKFRTAEQKCSSLLRSAQPGAAAGPPGASAEAGPGGPAAAAPPAVTG